MIKLYSYWRSSAAYRVRIALNLKGLKHEIVPVHLMKDGGEQYKADYTALNPQGLVPTLIDDDVTIGQSIAILEYLEETYPQPALLPQTAAQRAFARQIMQLIACDIHPLDNLRVLQYLKNTLAVDEGKIGEWYLHWISKGFSALETLLVSGSGPYCLGKDITLADVCLIPQLYNAHRFNIPLDAYPALIAIEQASRQLDAFDKARPENQIDGNRG